MDASVFGKAKNDSRRGLGGELKPARGPGRWPGEGAGAKPPNNFFFDIKHAKTVIVRVENISNHTVVTQNNIILTFSTIISLSLGNR